MFKCRAAHKPHIAIISGSASVADAIDAAAHLQTAGCAISLHPKSTDTAAESLLTRADAVLMLVTPAALRSKSVRQAVRASRQAGRRLFWITLEPLADGELPASFAVIDGTTDLPEALDRFLHAIPPTAVSPVWHRRVFAASGAAAVVMLALMIIFGRGTSHPDEGITARVIAPIAHLAHPRSFLPATPDTPTESAATLEAESTVEAKPDPYASLYLSVLLANKQVSDDATPDSTATDDDESSLTADFVPDVYYGDVPLTVTFENISTGAITSYAWDFDGDGVTDSTAENPPAFTYTEPGTYNISLTITGDNGETAVRYDYVDAYEPSTADDVNDTSNSDESVATDMPVAGFAVSPASGPAPLTVSFSNRSLGTITGYAWDFDSDGITDSTAQSPEPFVYSTPGDYRIALTVSGAGSSDTSTSFVTVTEGSSSGAPSASFIVTPRSGNLPLRVSVTNSSSGDAASYAWDFNGDGATDSTDKNPASYTYTAPGEYHLKLTITGRNGSSNSTSETIKAGNTSAAPVKPVAIFTANPLFGSAPLNVTFTSRSTGTITGYAWDFNGDGRTDSTAPTPPAYTFTQPGDYTVTLKVTGAGGMSSTTTDLITVDAADIDAPVAGFQGRPLFGTAPLSVTFTGQSLGAISTYAWDFNGDGVTDSTQKNPPAYVYSQPGDYTVTLKVTGAGGTDTTSDTVTVDAPDDADLPEPPAAIFVATPDFGTAPLNVTFNNLSDSASSYAWDFNGDNVTDSTQKNPPVYTYTQPGNYTVTLTVTGAGGTDTTTDTITVNPPEIIIPPSAALSLTPNTGTAPLVVNISNQSTGDITGYAWDFNGDGTTDSTAQNPPAYTYTQPGNYNVTLKVTGKDGSISTASASVIVTAPVIPPLAVMTATPNTGTAPLVVTISNQSTGDITGYAWDFNGDGTTDSTDKNPAPYTYTEPGLYTLKLTVIGKDGTTSAANTQITVIMPAEPVAAFTATPLTGEAPLSVTLLNTSTGDTLTSGWDFEGDGTIDSLDMNPAPSVYSEPGIYTLTLSARDRYGRINTTSVTITVIVPVTPETVTPTPSTTTPTPDTPTETVTPTPTDTAVPDTPPAEITPEATTEPAPDSTTSA